MKRKRLTLIGQPRFIDYINANADPVEITVSVKKWFLKRLKDFGIEYILGKSADLAVTNNTPPPASKPGKFTPRPPTPKPTPTSTGNGDVHLMKINPLPMIDWSDLQKADILLVRGGVIPAGIIRYGTWSRYSHAALYTAEAGQEIIESLGRGPEMTAKKRFWDTSGDIVLARRHRFCVTLGKQTEIVDKAKKYDYLKGKTPAQYDTGGGVIGGGGNATWLGKVVTQIPLVPPLPVLPRPPKFTLGDVNDTKDAFFGKNKWLFCSELVALAYREAGLKIGVLEPRNVAPSILAEERLSLKDVGFLKYMV